jgi:hypothetical protein
LLALFAVDGIDPGIEAQVDVLFGIPFQWADEQAFAFEFAQQVLLRQRRTLVGRVRLLADQQQRLLSTERDIPGNERGCRLTRTNDNDGGGHGLFRLGDVQDETVEFVRGDDLATQAAVVLAFDVGHFQHGVFDIVDFTGFLKPGRIDKNVAGGAGQASPALALDVGTLFAVAASIRFKPFLTSAEISLPSSIFQVILAIVVRYR